MADTLKLTSIRDGAPARAERSAAPLAVALAVAGAALAAWSVVLAVDAGAGAGEFLRSGLVVAWAGAAILVALARPDEHLGVVVALGAAIGGVGAAGASLLADQPSSGIARVALAARPAALMLVAAAGLHLVCALPDGRLRKAGQRAVVVGGYVAAIATAVVLWTKRPSLPIWPAVAGAALVVLVGGGVSAARYRRVKALERKRMQWFGWGITIAAGIAVLTAATHLLVKLPSASALPDIAGGATVFVPLGLAFASSKRASLKIDRILAQTISLAGLTGLVVVVYFVIVLGLGRVPTARERSLLLLSMVAAGVAALLYLPTRERLTAFATRLVYGERHAPDEAIRTFSQRLSRAIPLDELLLQMAESLRKTLALHAAEVWTGSAGAFERAVSSPERPKAELSLGPAEEPIVGRSGVSGPAWMKVWMPALLAGRESAILRVAPVTHSGELLGLIVVERHEGAEPFTADEELILAELARQVGLALHNVKLDSALQASLDEVRRQAEELRASRARIVATADEERRRIERNLHDGAQQHLVALAVKVRLIKQLAAANPDQAKQMLEELGGDVQTTLEELRTLAHGIYPPLLMDRGLAEALSAAAARAALPVEVRADGVGRFRPEVEAAVYFCCLEALQNAAKHAGEGARAIVSVREEGGGLLFEVADDGAGFDAADPRMGAGFTNMRDRLGAIGGALTVESQPGAGAKISGRIPVPR